MNRTTTRILVLVSLAMSLAACGGAGSDSSVEAESIEARSARIAQDILIVDTHVDLPYRLKGDLVDLVAGTEDGHFDYPRARAGGLDAPFMSIYVPASTQETGDSFETAERLIDLVKSIETRWPDRFAVVGSPDELRTAVKGGKIALPMGMENGAPVEGDLGNLSHFADRGISYITLTHSENNEICDSSYAEERTWGGLSEFGRDVVAEMNRLGIMVDVSHVSDDTFWQVLELTTAPVIASHSSCRKFTEGWERNMDDDMIRALAENGGVIQINFGSAFINGEAQKRSEQAWRTVGTYVREHELEWDSDEVKARMDRFWEENGRVVTYVAEVVDHIDHAVSLAGVDHVGLGSDFDGVMSLPVGLEDVSHYPDLIAELLRRGYGEDDVRKICGENLMRVWSDVRRVAAEAS